MKTIKRGRLVVVAENTRRLSCMRGMETNLIIARSKNLCDREVQPSSLIVWNGQRRGCEDSCGLLPSEKVSRYHSFLAFSQSSNKTLTLC